MRRTGLCPSSASSAYVHKVLPAPAEKAPMHVHVRSLFAVEIDGNRRYRPAYASCS